MAKRRWRVGLLHLSFFLSFLLFGGREEGRWCGALLELNNGEGCVGDARHSQSLLLINYKVPRLALLLSWNIGE